MTTIRGEVDFGAVTTDGMELNEMVEDDLEEQSLDDEMHKKQLVKGKMWTVAKFYKTQLLRQTNNMQRLVDHHF